MEKNNPPLRFAALIRVSSERQEKRGESLRTQEQQITDAVALLGGVVTARYAGQEHATPGWERTQLNKLLVHAGKQNKPFDAVIVADPSRWSRDNAANENGLDVLRNNGIRFFVLMQEYDLYDPNARGNLGLQTAMNSYQAALLAHKSVLNRIAKAKRGLLAVGSRPYGRTFDRQTGKWSVDHAKKAMIADIAKRYIDGESLDDLAQEYGIDRAGLHRNLMGRCGPTWRLTFNVPRFNISATIDVPIPPLLDAATIAAVRQRAEGNKTYAHGCLTHQYLFSRMVFCGHCNRPLPGQYRNGAPILPASRVLQELPWRHGARRRLGRGCHPAFV